MKIRRLCSACAAANYTRKNHWPETVTQFHSFTVSQFRRLDARAVWLQARAGGGDRCSVAVFSLFRRCYRSLFFARKPCAFKALGFFGLVFRWYQQRPGLDRHRAYRIVGITYSAPARMPVGQRPVTVFSRVSKRTSSLPYTAMSPKSQPF